MVTSSEGDGNLKCRLALREVGRKPLGPSGPQRVEPALEWRMWGGAKGSSLLGEGAFPTE